MLSHPRRDCRITAEPEKAAIGWLEQDSAVRKPSDVVLVQTLLKNARFLKELKYTCLQLEACSRMQLTMAAGGGILPLTSKERGRGAGGRGAADEDKDEELHHIIIKGAARAVEEEETAAADDQPADDQPGEGRTRPLERRTGERHLETHLLPLGPGDDSCATHRGMQLKVERGKHLVAATQTQVSSPMAYSCTALNTHSAHSVQLFQLTVCTCFLLRHHSPIVSTSLGRSSRASSSRSSCSRSSGLTSTSRRWSH